ncbi:energy-coupling factor transporter transmembrane component T [Blautia massiliensis (ex Durand et al. 2017)]|uniref:energy-coupling factor transporter transmembrane component T n=1 Tax=Blautia massiliensis (ex Durand et al. 2017) TaxID=1737424 RepID=UPI00073F5661|nr:energy-coupling factor transporter transmembrane component T [Blautia massiliensis (ex Durand et al. 2017)]
MTPQLEHKTRFLNFDPRTKIILIGFCALTATTTPTLQYECILIALISVYGTLSGKIRYTIIGTAFYFILYGLTMLFLQDGAGMAHTMFIAWLSLFFKVYPCGLLSGIVLSTTRVNEFLSAMNKAHIPKKVVIPFAVMLRYFPTVREDWHYIKDAMRLRDVSPSFKSFIKNPNMTIECVYVPLLMAASKAADELSIAAVTRGIENPLPRTCIVQIRFRIRDVLIIGCFLALFVVGLFI